MADLLGVLCILVFVLAIVVAVGHGIWVGLAKLFGGGDAPAAVPSGNPAQRAHCRTCGYLVLDGRSRCPRCATSMLGALVQHHAARPNEDEDRQAAIRQLGRLWQAQKIDAALHERLLQLLQPAAHTAPVAAPSVTHQVDFPAPLAESIVTAELAGDSDSLTDFKLAPLAATPSTAPAVVRPAFVAAKSEVAAEPAEHRQLSDMLHAFLESRNIRWGELASGVLIVGSAVGLVISLRKTLVDFVPYFPALIFMLGTAAIYGAGMYTLRRWRLRSTSRGLLTIAMLLAPLNFLAAVLLSERRTLDDPLYWTAIVLGLGSYAWMTRSACRELVPWAGRWLAVGIMGASAAQLVIDRTTTTAATQPASLAWLTALPVLAFLLAMVRTLSLAGRLQRWTSRRAGQVYMVAGMAAFALAPAMALLVWRGKTVDGALAVLAPWLSMAASAVLTLGLMVFRKTTAAGWRTSGTAVALVAASVMLGVLGLTWPRPDLLIVMGVINFLTLTAIGRACKFPVLHAVAAICLAAATLLAIERPWMPAGLLEAVQGRTLVEFLLLGRSAMLLTGLAGAAAAVAGALRRRKQSEESVAYLAAAGILAVLGFASALYTGFWGHEGLEWATLVLALDAVAAVAVAAVIRRTEATLAASALVLLAIAHALAWHPAGAVLLEPLSFGARQLWATVLLTHATLVSVVAIGAALVGRREPGRGGAALGFGFIAPLVATAVAGSGVALLLSLVVWETRFALHGSYILWGAALWLTGCIVLRSRAWLAPAQIVATVGISYLTTAMCQQQGWWSGSWINPLHVEIQLVALSLWAVVCHGARLTARTLPAVASLAKTVGISVERLLVYGLMVVVVALAAGDCRMPVYQQLGLTTKMLPLAAWPNLPATFGGWGGWIVLGAVAVAGAVVSWRRPRWEEWVLWPALMVSIPLLFAKQLDAQNGAAAVLAWGMGAYFVCGVLLLAGRDWLLWQTGTSPRRRLGFSPGHISSSSPRHAQTRWLAFGAMVLFGAAPLLWIVGGATIAAGQGRLLAPAAGSWFDQLGPAVTWCTPLVLLGLGVAITAMRERKNWLALPACGAIMAATVLSNVIPRWLVGQWIDEVRLAVILQQTAIVAAGLAISWQLIVRGGKKWLPSERATAPNSDVIADMEVTDALPAQLFIVGLLGGLVSVWPAGAIFFSPDSLPAVVHTLGQWPSYVAIVLSALALRLAKGYLGQEKESRRVRTTLATLGFAALAAPLAAASVTSISMQRAPWLSFHVLSGGWAAVAIVATGAALVLRRTSAAHFHGAAAASGICVVMCVLALACAVRGVQSDPLAPWWSTGLVVAVAGITAAHAIRSRREELAYLTTALAAGALVIYWFGSLSAWSADLVYNLAQQLICLTAVLATGWLGTKLYFARSATDAAKTSRRGLPLTCFALTGGAVLAAMLVGLGSLIAWLGGAMTTMSGPWGWGMVGCLGVLATVMLWSADSRLALKGIYALGLIGLGLILDLAQTNRQWALGAVLGTAGWVALTGMAWNLRTSWIALGRRLCIWQPEETVHSVWKWLPAVSVVLTGLVVFAAGCAELLGYYPSTRTLAALAVALAAPGLAMFGQGHLSRRMPRLSLLVAGIAAVYLAWAMVSRTPVDTFWLRMSIRTLVALGAMAALYGLGLVRLLDRAGDWLAATRQSAALMGIAALVSLGGVLALELVHFKSDGGIVAATEVAQVVVVLVGLAGALLSLALLPGADPLGLSEKGRMLYVYGAQIVLALLFAHVYLTMPYLFQHRLRPYWPLIVMGVSYAGVIFGMLARRAKLRVLAEPLERTGGFLPLLPALGFFFLTSEVSYSAVMAAVAVVYVLLSSNEKRLIYRVAAAVAGNAALWALMYEQGIAPWSYPSFWALPPAFSLLIAAQLNRRRLEDEQLTAIRYLCITVIYLSSTGQIWLMLGQSLWPPMLLAMLSVAGIFSGIALRVRAFLYQGMSFLGLAVLSMIWHASRHIGHVWPWWAFGVVLGLSILALFGIFEKKRPEMLVLVERMKQWER